MCLHVGMKHATQIANTLNVPLLPINHLEAHILMARMANFGGINQRYPELLAVPRFTYAFRVSLSGTISIWWALHASHC